MKKSERSSRKKIDYKKMASGLSPVTEVKGKEKSKIAEVTAPAGASIADKLSEPKDTSTPVKLTLPVNPGDEKSSLLNKLAELDKKQKQLQEKKELETLRKQVEEREEAVRELEKSLTEPVRKGKSKESSSEESGGAKPKKHKSRLAASFQEGQTPSTSTESGQSGVMVHIISDSIAKDVGGIWHTKVIAFPGIGITRLSVRIQSSPYLVSKPVTIIHVGTNDINPRNPNEEYSVDDIISFYNNMITLIRNVNPHTHIVFSSILPRPCDYEQTKDKIKQVNQLLEVKCKERYCQFIHSFRPFFKYGKPVRALFAVRDKGLHLNLEGTRQLRKFFINTVSHLLKGKLAM
ncbi:uncharacterized protein LOC123524817 [Mercenaria mercenaria]|uniref:uncharacterized protein LOC123524817 n=1 Tax=Mercenaria mercenaria TaxID=6596 RepID=UPI001E1D3539|nr:uncharacterized protein LOC123524817 [Mercenaria mercenaria]